MKHLLIVEDDENLIRGISFAFEKDGFVVFCAGMLDEARQILSRQSINIIILDIGLPDGNGVDLCREIRRTSDIPIIMLTANDLETDEVLGLSAGADDYVTKPFSLAVLRARVEAVSRRRVVRGRTVIQRGQFSLDAGLCKLFRDGDEISISPAEFRLLHYLISNAGQVLTKEQLLSNLWDSQGNFVDENTLPVNISRLRQKIEADPRNPQVIKTVHGMGYIWV